MALARDASCAFNSIKLCRRRVSGAVVIWTLRGTPSAWPAPGASDDELWSVDWCHLVCEYPVFEELHAE